MISNITQPIILKKFVPDRIIKVLNCWCLNNYKNDFFLDANMGTIGTRLSTRYSVTKTFYFPKEAYELKEKIKKELKLENTKIPSYRDGIVCGIGFEGGDISLHTDPIYHEGTSTWHCNVITQKSNFGGITVINGREYDVNSNDVLVYKVSSWPHSVTTIEGDKPRILWVFGYCV